MLPRHVGRPEPLPAFGPLDAGGSWTQGLGTVSFQRKGFQAKPRLRDKRPSVHPWVPSPGFPEQHSFMPAATPPAPPPAPPPSAHCGLSPPLGRLVCLSCRVQAFCCPSLFSPPQALCIQTLPGHRRVWGPGGGLGAKAESGPGAWAPHPHSGSPPRGGRGGA